MVTSAISILVPIFVVLCFVVLLVLLMVAVPDMTARTLSKETFCPVRKSLLKVIFSLNPFRKEPQFEDVSACSAFAPGETLRCGKSCVKHENDALTDASEKDKAAA